MENLIFMIFACMSIMNMFMTVMFISYVINDKYGRKYADIYLISWLMIFMTLLMSALRKGYL